MVKWGTFGVVGAFAISTYVRWKQKVKKYIQQ